MTKQSKNLDRILSFVLAAVSLLALFLPYKVIMTNGDGNFTASAKLLFLSFGGSTDGVGLLSLLAVIVMLTTAVASAVISILAIVNSYNAPTLIRVSSLVLSTGAGMYCLSVFSLSMHQSNLNTAFDWVSLIIAAISLSIFAVLSIRKHGKFASKPAGQYLAILISTVLLVLSVAASKRTANVIVIGLISLAWLSLVFSQICVMYTFESSLLHRIRLIAHLAIAFLLCLVCLFSLGLTAFILSFLGTLAAAVPVAENFLNHNEDADLEDETTATGDEYTYSEYSETSEEDFDENEPELEMFPSIPRPKMVAPEESFEQPVAKPLDSYQVEEYAEAVAYEGGPVSGVELAEEVNPTYIPKGQVSTGGYDFYNCQSFDPFIASLNNEERNQFTEIFILKYKGTMPELPDYVVGGDNREFFRKVFIYLGQYRDRIPSGLLSKIYAFSTKIS